VNFLYPLFINIYNNTILQVILDTFNYPDFFQADQISNYIKK
ncbi:flagellar biosynthesis protein FliW, partial [Campylobacter jejuni]|nr:flagellar biosynthesis protein FliW [Campylobacter jejuni]